MDFLYLVRLHMINTILNINGLHQPAFLLLMITFNEKNIDEAQNITFAT